MEVYRQHGIADSIYEVGCPIEKFGQIRWMTSLGGDGPLDRKEIHRMDAFGGNSLRARYDADSPVMASNYPQLRLEPLLRQAGRDARTRSDPLPPRGSLLGADPWRHGRHGPRPEQ